MAGRSKPRAPRHSDWTPSPARGETRSAPPFEPQNVAALQHGAYSERSINQVAAEVRQHLIQYAPHLDQPMYAMALARFLRAESRELLLHSAISNIVTTRGIERVPPSMWEQATAASNLAAKQAARLGLDPMGYAALRRETGSALSIEASLDDLMRAGAATRAGRGLRSVDAQTGPESTESPANDTPVVRDPDGAA